MGHGTFNSNKIYFVLIASLIEYRKELARITAKCYENKIIVKERCFRFQTCVCQEVSNEVSLAWFKFQAKITCCFGVRVPWEWQKYTPPYPLLSKDEGLSNIGHSISIGNVILGVDSVIFDSLWQFIAKCGCYFIIKCDRSLLQNASGFLLRDTTVVLQNATGITNCDDCITKFLRLLHLLNIATLQRFIKIGVSGNVKNFSGVRNLLSFLLVYELTYLRPKFLIDRNESIDFLIYQRHIRIQSSICNGAMEKISIVDVRLGSKYVTDTNRFVTIKLKRWFIWFSIEDSIRNVLLKIHLVLIKSNQLSFFHGIMESLSTKALVEKLFVKPS